MKLKDRVAIITGSSRGLGKILAFAFAKEGARVVVAARSEVESGKLPGTIYQTAEAIRAEGGFALPIKCDVSSEESINAMVQRTLDELGRVDILINNSGIAVTQSTLEITLKRWELALKINLTGAFLCSKAVLPGMIERRSGSIINITSVASIRRTPEFTGIIYGVSKAGLDRFTTSLAAEVGKYNIAVNALRPVEGIATEGLMAQSRGETSERWDTPDKFIRAAIFLAGQTAAGVTGMVANDEEYCLWHGLI
jgi:NAD(P)-dependent dehydrogenase (short-subunit alcohol dehydrogenase family)